MAVKKQSRAPAKEGDTLALAREARLHLFVREHSPRTLARALCVTSGELTPVLAAVKRELAGQGIRLRLVRRAGRARFQLLGVDQFLERAWRDFDRSLREFWARPALSRPDPGAWSREDQELYGRGGHRRPRHSP
jgi:hypothetical protein